MGVNLVNAEASSGSARIRLQTYRYSSPSEMSQSPQDHVLTLFTSPLSPDSRGFFRQEGARSGEEFRFGNLIFVPAGASIHGSGPGGERKMVSCMFDRTQAAALTELGDDWSESELLRCGDVRNADLTAAMQRLGSEVAAPGFASDVMLDALTAAVLVHLARYLRSGKSDEAPNRGGLAAHQLRAIEDFVRAWDGGALKAQDLAAVIGVSRGHLMRAFKQSTGRTVLDFVGEVRVERAKTMIVADQLPLKRIASQLGFSNATTFSHAFRRATMTTPAQYRRRVLN